MDESSVWWLKSSRIKLTKRVKTGSPVLRLEQVIPSSKDLQFGWREEKWFGSRIGK